VFGFFLLLSLRATLEEASKQDACCLLSSQGHIAHLPFAQQFNMGFQDFFLSLMVGTTAGFADGIDVIRTALGAILAI
jgi:hypothetical protein